MRNGIKFLILIGILLTVYAGTGRAQTNVYYNHGTSCQPGFGVFAQTGYGEPGIGNFSNSAEARVFCPMNRTEFRTNDWPLTTVSLGILRYTDTSSTVPFWGYMWVSENSGATYWSIKKYTCSGSQGGCFDSTTEFVGFNALTWNYPFGRDQFFNEPTIGYSCNIPRTAGGFASWIYSYETFTQPSSF